MGQIFGRTKFLAEGRESPDMHTALQPAEDKRGSWRIFATEFSRGPSIARWAPIPLRLLVGFGFMQHGFAKLSRGPDAFATILQALGVPAPHFMARERNSVPSAMSAASYISPVW